MKSCLSTIGLGIAVFAFFGFQPAVAGCQYTPHTAPDLRQRLSRLHERSPSGAPMT